MSLNHDVSMCQVTTDGVQMVSTLTKLEALDMTCCPAIQGKWLSINLLEIGRCLVCLSFGTENSGDNILSFPWCFSLRSSGTIVAV